MDEAVRKPQAEGTIIKIVGDGDDESVEKYAQFMVRPGMERPYFQRSIFVSPGCMVTKDRVLIEIKMIKNLINALKKHMFPKRMTAGGLCLAAS